MFVAALLLLYVIAIATGCLSLHGRLRSAPLRTRIIYFSLMLGVLRLFVLGAAISFHGHSDWRQVAGYFLLLVNSPIELTLVAHLRNEEPLVWGAALSICVALTSLLGGLALAVFSHRFTAGRLRRH